MFEPQYMAERGLYVLKIIVLAFVTVNGRPPDPCPKQCQCVLGSTVDCADSELATVPDDLPSWTTVLYLQNNKINHITASSFKGLEKLQEIELGRNKLRYVDGSAFSDLPKLQSLKLEYNELAELPVFSRPANITKLLLHHNRIRSLKWEALIMMPHLRTLDLNNNRVTALPGNVIPPLPKLQHLYLNNNGITVVTKNALNNLTNLEVLKLNKNQIVTLPKNFLEQNYRLRQLELNRNRLRLIAGLTFQKLERLKILKLKRNDLQELADGAFYGLASIQRLELDRNNISVVSEGWLYGMRSLRELSASQNNIAHIDPSGWDVCKGLWRLDLSNNVLRSITPSTFHKLGSLQYLFLNNNRLQHVHQRAFVAQTGLRMLEMNRNVISWAFQEMNDVFDGLNNLERLQLAENRIRDISVNAFRGLTRLQQLHLTGNAISQVHNQAFSPLVKLNDIRMNSSNFLCDCHMSWLPEWLRERGFDHAVSVRCAHPERLAGRSLLELQMEDFKCDDFPVPIMITNPQQQYALIGGNLTLTCVATSSDPAPMSHSWFKDDNLLVNADVTASNVTNEQKFVQYTTVLRIGAVTESAAGSYQCVIRNHLGERRSKRADVRVYVFPNFGSRPSDVTVRAGAQARFECTANGKPLPEILLQKDGGDDFPAARERRMRYHTDAFVINNVSAHDRGVYSCVATNPTGTVVANATLRVMQLPSLQRPMRDLESEQGKDTVLYCFSNGNPPPQRVWLKDGEPLEADKRRHFASDKQILIILRTEAADAGLYTCEMTNNLGMERGSMRLDVIPPRLLQASFDSESTVTGIVVIVVVCCVVGTSLVWVVIIYQTRRDKRATYSPTPTSDSDSGGSGTQPCPKPPFANGYLPCGHTTSGGTPLTQDEQSPTVTSSHYSLNQTSDEVRAATSRQRLTSSPPPRQTPSHSVTTLSHNSQHPPQQAPSSGRGSLAELRRSHSRLLQEPAPAHCLVVKLSGRETKSQLTLEAPHYANIPHVTSSLLSPSSAAVSTPGLPTVTECKLPTDHPPPPTPDDVTNRNWSPSSRASQALDSSLCYCSHPSASCESCSSGGSPERMRESPSCCSLERDDKCVTEQRHRAEVLNWTNNNKDLDETERALQNEALQRLLPPPSRDAPRLAMHEMPHSTVEC